MQSPARGGHIAAVPDFASRGITAQQVCSIGPREDLSGGNGISKTAMWKNYASVRELRRCENVPHACC
jgi:hypothetical protein